MGNRLFPLNTPGQNVYAVGAAIGIAMPLGIGAAMAADGRKVVAMCGDGGFMVNLGELWTAVQERADVVFLVMNDAGYGVIKHIQDKMYGGRNYFADLAAPDLEGLAGVAGIPFHRVSSAEDLGPVVCRAVAVDGPALVEVAMNEIGPFPPYYKPPPYVDKRDS